MAQQLEIIILTHHQHEINHIGSPILAIIILAHQQQEINVKSTLVAADEDGFDCEANIEKRAVAKAGDDDVNILEYGKGLDAESLLFKTVKVLGKVAAEFKQKSPTDSSEEKTSSETPVEPGPAKQKDIRENRAEEADPEIGSNEFEQGKDGKDDEPEGGRWRRGLYHEADEGAGEDEHDDPEQVVQPGEQLERGAEERIGGK